MLRGALRLGLSSSSMTHQNQPGPTDSKPSGWTRSFSNKNRLFGLGNGLRY